MGTWRPETYFPQLHDQIQQLGPFLQLPVLAGRFFGDDLLVPFLSAMGGARVHGARSNAREAAGPCPSPPGNSDVQVTCRSPLCTACLNGSGLWLKWTADTVTGRLPRWINGIIFNHVPSAHTPKGNFHDWVCWIIIGVWSTWHNMSHANVGVCLLRRQPGGLS